MSKFIRINTKDLTLQPFECFKNGTLLLAGDEKDSNSLCVSNVMFGQMWDKDVVMIALKPLRFTKEFVDLNETFSLNFFDDKYQKEIDYIGSVSGRDVNKMKKSNLKVSVYRGTPFYEQSNTVIFCKKLYTQEFKESSFIDTSLIAKNYLFKDFHSIYIAEIIRTIKLSDAQ